MLGPFFLSSDTISAYHQQQLELFGGQVGIRDRGLLESAVAQPQYVYLYNPQADLFDIATAYAFSLTKNHPFLDGNKRTALHAALAFLRVNAVELAANSDELYQAMISLTTSTWSKDEFARFLRSQAHQPHP